jgi:murein lipoprotein
MTTVTDNDLKELKDLINSRFDLINSRFDRIETKVDNLSQDVNELKVEVGKIKENIGGLDTRLKNLEFTNRGIFISIVAGLVLAGLGALAKFLLFDVSI